MPHGTPRSRAVLDLALDDRAVGLVEQRARIARASPAAASGTRTSSRSRRAARALPPARRQRPPEPEPVLGRDLARGDRHEAGQPRLRGQQVVVRRVEPAVGDVEADREELPLGVEEKLEVHLFDEIVGQRREPLGALDRSAAAARLLERAQRSARAAGRRPASVRALAASCASVEDGAADGVGRATSVRRQRSSMPSSSRQPRPPRPARSSQQRPRVGGDSWPSRRRLLELVQQRCRPIGQRRAASPAARATRSGRRGRVASGRAGAELAARSRRRGRAATAPRSTRLSRSSSPSSDARRSSGGCVGELDSACRSVSR